MPTRNNLNTNDDMLQEDGAGATARQQAILDRVQRHGFATIEEMATELGVSGQTIRREIKRMEDLGILRRFHGGAGLVDAPVRRSYAEKAQIGRDGKQRIAQRTAREIPAGAAVFLDVGTTVDAVAEAMLNLVGLRVFTNNLRAALILSEAEKISTFVTGGSVGGRDGSLTGEVALRALALVRCDVAVIGFSAIAPDGSILDFDHDKIAIKRAMMRHARRTYLVGQVEKFGRDAVVRLGGIEEVSAVITDAQPPAWAKELALRHDIPILLA